MIIGESNLFIFENQFRKGKIFPLLILGYNSRAAISYAAVINELGYPSRMELRNWVKEYKDNDDVKKGITRGHKYSDKEKRKAVNHFQRNEGVPFFILIILNIF